ncbi:hypothetical protein ACWGB8_25550 [Kitasatospora sp. NPDC054939]
MRTQHPVLAVALTAATGVILAVAAVLGLVAAATSTPDGPDTPLVTFTG